MKNAASTALATLLVTAAPAAADYPEDAIRVIVPFAAGGMSDTFARIFQRQLEGAMPQPLVVVNVPGGGGAIGSRQVKNAEPDGYTMLKIHDGLLTAAALGVTEYGADAFAPVAQTGSSWVVVTVPEDSPYQTLEELLQAACEEPGTIKEATNIGAIVHFASLMLTDASGCAEFRYVQTGGGADRFSSLEGGHVDMSMFSTTEYRDYGESLRGLAILAPERHSAFPDLPTAKEQGYDAVFGIDIWWFMPEGTPEERVSHMADQLEQALASDEVQRQFDNRTMSPVFARGEELEQRIEEQSETIHSLAEQHDMAQ